MSHRLETWNYHMDPRTQAPAEKPILYLDDEEIELPTCWEVCPVCHGEGRHVNPSIDCGGLDQDSLDDLDFMDDYLAGAYDVVCNCCRGRTTVPVADTSRMTDDQVRAWELQQAEEAEYQAICRAERAMGA